MHMALDWQFVSIHFYVIVKARTSKSALTGLLYVGENFNLLAVLFSRPFYFVHESRMRKL